MATTLQHFSHGVDFPQRIVCLSDETTETLYLLGEQDRIVGISGFTTRPLEARNKPRISSFCDANLDAVLDLHPDLVLTFSDVQAATTRQLVLRGLTVLNFNQRSIAGIFQMIGLLARIVGQSRRGMDLVSQLQSGLDAIATSAATFPRRLRVYFEEWNDPLISGISWVDELIEIAGGLALFPELRACGKAQDRIVDPAEVVRRDPEVILASWCGMKVNLAAMLARRDWASTSAARHNQLHEIPSSIILQPGPAALTDGIWAIHSVLADALAIPIPEELRFSPPPARPSSR